MLRDLCFNNCQFKYKEKKHHIIKETSYNLLLRWKNCIFTALFEVKKYVYTRKRKLEQFCLGPNQGATFMEISKEVRQKIQPIGK